MKAYIEKCVNSKELNKWNYKDIEDLTIEMETKTKWSIFHVSFSSGDDMVEARSFQKFGKKYASVIVCQIDYPSKLSFTEKEVIDLLLYIDKNYQEFNFGGKNER